jgi:protein SCO1
MKLVWKLLSASVVGLALVWTVQQRLHTLAEPAVMGTVTSNLSLHDKSGRQVNLLDLRGKVVVAAHYYSTCPMGCAVLAEKMQVIFKAYEAQHLELQMLSFAIDPEDTPERLAAFAKDGFEIDKDNTRWWFVNGDQQALRSCLEKDFQFNPVREKPPAEQTSPVDKYAHDMRIAVLDTQLRLRGLYNVMAAEPAVAKNETSRLVKDVQWLLED